VSKKPLTINDLEPEVRKKVLAAAGKTRRSPNKTFTVEHERRYALRVLAEISDLSQSERARVLARATKVNNV